MKAFKTALWSIGAVTFILAILTIGSALRDGYAYRTFCFNSACIEEFRTGYAGTAYVVSSGLKLLGATVGIFGLYIALKKYLISVTSAALTSHTVYVQLFEKYLITEIGRREHLAASNIDVFGWYNSIFPLSAEGDVRASDNYLKSISEILSSIEGTNETLSPGPGKFDYKQHQSKVIAAAGKIGVNLTRLPRKDFFAVETELLDLIDSVNVSFAPKAARLTEIDRAYL